MVAAQVDAVGDDLLDPGGADPSYWAYELHFFLTGVPFYNFPYAFGYLLSRGLFQELERQGPDFLPRYEQFLMRSGSVDAHELAREALGFDLEQPDFWRRSIRSLLPAIEQLQAELAGS